MDSGGSCHLPPLHHWELALWGYGARRPLAYPLAYPLAVLGGVP